MSSFQAIFASASCSANLLRTPVAAVVSIELLPCKAAVNIPCNAYVTPVVPARVLIAACSVAIGFNISMRYRLPIVNVVSRPVFQLSEVESKPR